MPSARQIAVNFPHKSIKTIYQSRTFLVGQQYCCRLLSDMQGYSKMWTVDCTTGNYGYG